MKTKPLRARQFWPYTMPIGRTQILSAYGAAGHTLNISAALNRHRAPTAQPLPNDRLSYPQGSGERRLGKPTTL